MPLKCRKVDSNAIMSIAPDKTKLSTSGYDFIDEAYLHSLLNRQATAGEVRDVIAKSMAKEPLTLEEWLERNSPEHVGPVQNPD